MFLILVWANPFWLWGQQGEKQAFIPNAFLWHASEGLESA